MPRFQHLIELFDESLLEQDRLEINLYALKIEIENTLSRFGSVPRLIEILSTINIVLNSIIIAKQYR